MPAPEDVWIPLVDEPIGSIVALLQAENPDIDELVSRPHRILAFRTFAYIRVGILLGRLLVDDDVPAYDGTETWVETLLRDPAHRQAVVEELRAVAEEVASDPQYADDSELGPDDAARAALPRVRPPTALAFRRRGILSRWQNEVTVRRRLALLLALSFLVFGSAGAAGPATAPTAAATATAIQITVPNAAGAQTQAAAAPPPSSPVLTSAFAYPDDGAIVAAASTTASASTTVSQNAAAKAEADVTAVSLFRGELTADSVTARASAGTGPSGAGGNQNGSGVSNLRFDGQPVSGTQAALGSWGRLTLDVTAADQSAPAGTRGYRGTVTELDLKLLADHGGLPAGSEIRIGLAQAAVQTAPPPPPVTTTTAPTTTEATTTFPSYTNHHPLAPKQKGPHPLRAHPKLGATGGYVFPVYGPVSYGDSYGAFRADVSYHHGDDIFGRLGQPIVACVTGTVFSVGWNKVGGNRLWILDDQGNQFYYAHLSAFSTAATNGARVRKGEVIGFMGDTGDAEGSPYHLHFEVHPVAFLYKGYDGAVDPTKYLEGWKHEQDLPFPVAGGWVPEIPGGRLPAGARGDPARDARHLLGERARPRVASARARAWDTFVPDADARAELGRPEGLVAYEFAPPFDE